MVKIRIAIPDDAASLLEIYSPYVLTTAFTFETEVPSVKDFSGRMEKYLQKYPWLVCEIDRRLVGYVYASVHREREAYQWTCECSVYVSELYKGKGIGKELYDVLFMILKMQGLVNVYAGITLPNEPSINLHEKCGFRNFANYENIGYKFNSWHKVGWWKLQLNEYAAKPSPPLKFSEINPETFTALFGEAEKRIESRLIG